MDAENTAVIAILDDYEGFVKNLDAFARLKARLPRADIRIFSDREPSAIFRQAAHIQYLVLTRERTRVDAEYLENFPSLKAICQTGTIGRGSTAHVDARACEARGVKILEGKTDGYSAAELTWALVMAAARHVPDYVCSMRDGAWQERSPAGQIGHTLHGKVLGILGYGRIGQIIAGYGSAFGMTVQAWGRESSMEKACADGFAVPQSREEFFRTSDVLSLHLRLNEDTRHSVRLSDLQNMKPSALLVNTSRADLIEPEALLIALKGGCPGSAALDVSNVRCGDDVVE